MLQIMLTLTAFMVLVIPMGHYLYHIAVGQKTFADPVFDPVDRLIYKLCGLKGEDMGVEKIRSLPFNGQCGHGTDRICDPAAPGNIIF